MMFDCLTVLDQERCYKAVSSVDHLAIHFVLEGHLLHVDSDEARRQTAKQSLPEGMTTVSYPSILKNIQEI